MTLNEFNNKFWSRPLFLTTAQEPTTLYIFTDEDSAEDWIKHKYFGTDCNGYQLDMAIQSDMKLEHALKSEWCNAEVQQFYAIEPNAIAVVVERAEDKIYEKNDNNRKIVQKVNDNGNIQSVIIED
jgi:hypothetical protein